MHHQPPTRPSSSHRIGRESLAKGDIFPLHLRHDPSPSIGCMMYIRHRVRRSGEYAKPVARGRLDPERLGLSSSSSSCPRPVLAWRSCSRAHRATIYAAVNHISLPTPFPPPSLVKRRDRIRRLKRRCGGSSLRFTFERIFEGLEEGKEGKCESSVIRAERYRLF